MERVDALLEKIPYMKRCPHKGRGNHKKRAGKVGWTNYVDKRDLHTYFSSLPVKKGMWILIRKRKNVNWYPAKVLEVCKRHKPLRVFYYGDKHVYQKYGAVEGNPRGEYRIEDLMRYKTAMHAVLPDYIDLSDVHKYLGDNFDGWNDLRFAIRCLLDLGRIDKAWWQIEDRPSKSKRVFRKRRIKHDS